MIERLALAGSLNKYQIALEGAEEARPISDTLLPKSLQARKHRSACFCDDVEDSPDTIMALVEADQRLPELACAAVDSGSYEAASTNISTE